MIKIEIDENIKELIEKEHFQEIKNRVKSCIEGVHTIADYKNLHDYFFDEFGSVDEKKLKKINNWK
ncbi:hypothetical protein ACT7C7_05525 [Bacillus cereus]